VGDCGMSKQRHIRIAAMAVALSVTGLIYLLSDISDLSFFRNAKFPEFIYWIIETFNFHWGMGGYFSYGISFHPDNLIHKVGHIVLYGVLGISIFISTGQSARWTLLIVILLAIFDEWHQSMVPGRDGRFFDVVLDVVSAWGFIRFFPRSKSYFGRVISNG
jgi:hypothetical protein